jgi:hypothetical protein
MFKCQGCKTVQQPHSKPKRVVTEKRQVTYNNMGQISKGWEIVKEIVLCEVCYEGSPFGEHA